LNFGGGFGASVAIDGNRLVIGAPGDAPSSAQAVASFVPTIDNVSNNQVVFTSPHGLSEGQPISYARGAGYGDIGLNDGQLYYAKTVSGNANALQFALTPGGAAVSLSLPSTFTDQLGTITFVPSSTSIQGNRIVLPSDTTLATGQSVVYRNNNGDSSFGLVDGETYYVKRVPGDAKAIELALTPEAAGDVSGSIVPLVFPTRGADAIKLTNYGAAYVFERSDASSPWIETQKLFASEPSPGHFFGSSVAIRGNAVLVGAPGDTGNNTGNEAAYFFGLLNGNWELKSRQKGSGDFGRTVALAGNFGTVHFGQSSTANDFAVIGAPLGDEASVYRVTSVSVSPWTTLKATEPQSGEQFGSAVAATSRPRVDNINGSNETTQINRIVVGAPLWDGPAAYTGDTLHTDQGRVFVFDLVGSNWASVARLTAEGGLPIAEVATEARTGDRFGAAVALDSRYVVAGAPGHESGNSRQTGSAYVFYELKNGSTGPNASSWTRSTGGTNTSTGGPGSGRLEASSPAANDNFGSAVAVWHDPATGDGRTLVGIPGFDEPSSRTNLGAVRTFTTSGGIPDATQALLQAETLGLSNPASMTAYDSTSRTLFVADPTEQAVYVYINEGLYWRRTDNPLRGWVAGKTSGFGTDMDLDAVNGLLAVGAPGSSYVYIFQRQLDGTWGNDTASFPGKAIDGSAMGGTFGQSVAIDGNGLVVGAPTTTVKYNSTKQGINNYWLDLGLGPATKTVGTTSQSPTGNGSSVGAAHYYTRNYNSATGSYEWGYNRLLMPDDPNLPTQTSTFVDQIGPSGDVGRVFFGRFDASKWSEYGSGSGYFTPGSYDLSDYYWQGTKVRIDEDAVKIRIGPRTTVTMTSDDYTPDLHVTFDNPSYTHFAYVFFNQNQWLKLEDNQGTNLEFYTSLIDHRDEVDSFTSSIMPGSTSIPAVSTYYTFSMRDAQWGSSVDLVGGSAVVGAAGRSTTAVYDLNQPDYDAWNVQVPGLHSSVPIARANPAIFGQSGSFGSDVLATDGRFYSGAPGVNQVISYTGSGTNWTNTASFTVPTGVAGSLGGAHSITQAGSRVLIGAPSGSDGAGMAYLYDNAGNYQGVALKPYTFDSSAKQTKVDTTAVGFGTAPSIISDGFYLVGNNTSIAGLRQLYTFRQRGPGWSSNSDLTNTPAPLEKAKLGRSVAISGSTAVLGAPDFGNHGAILIFNNVGSSREPRWELQTQIDAPGFQTGDEFGASLAIEGDNLIVGAPGRDGGRGGAYFFEQRNGQWSLQNQLTGTVVGERLGSSVAIAGDFAAAGAPGVSSSATYVYERLSGEWTLDTKITTGQPGNKFGTSVHLDASTLFIGAPEHNSGQGAEGSVYIYTLSPSPRSGNRDVSTTTSLIPATGILAGDRFGASIDGSGNFVVVGAPGTAENIGAAYVFDRPTSSTPWKQTKLDYSAGANKGDAFGTSVAIDGVQIVVGTPGRTVKVSANQGEAFSYGLKNNGVWTLETPANLQDHVLTGARAEAGDQVGYSVAISGDFALLGAPQINGRPGVNDTDGSGYAFVRQVNPPSTKTLPETQTVLVAGASTNTIAGSIANNLIPTLQFFDIQDVRLKTNSANYGSGQPISTLEIRPEGFTAYGLQKFSAQGNIAFTNLSPNLTIPTVGLFEFIPNLDLSGTAPIAIDLDGNGLEFVSRSQTGPKFDWNGTGTREATAWLGGNDGWLFVDQSADVQVTRQELSFASTVPTAKSNLDALRIAYDSNKDNVLDSKDADWSKFKIWRDINLDGVTTASEILGLDALGIVSIGLIGDSQSYLAAAGGVKVLGQTTFARTNGSLGVVGDVVLNPDIGTVAPGSDRVVDSYDFIGGPDATYVALADTDWTLYDGFLTASDGRQRINLDRFNNVVLRGGSGNNRIEVVSWLGKVEIDGGTGEDTIVIHSGSGADVKIIDTGSEDQIDIRGTAGADQILVTPNNIDVFPSGSAVLLLHVDYDSAMTGKLRVSGGASNDEITLSAFSFSVVELDGGEGLDVYNLHKSGAASHTFISDSGPTDGTRDKIKVLVNGPTVVNGFMNQSDVRYNNPNAPLTYDSSIEEIEAKTDDPKLFLTGNGFFRIGLDSVLFNGSSYPLAGVTDLTITTTGDSSTIQVDQIPLTLTTLTVNASAGTGDTLIGTDQNNQWFITGPDSGRLNGTPNLNFTSIENLRGRSGTDRFTFNESGSIGGSLDGGDGSDLVDYSSLTSGITIDLGNGSFNNIETLIGGNGPDTLIGPDANTDWNVLSAGAGTVARINFSSIENLTGGDADDTFNLDSNSNVLGAINGGAGENRLLLRLSDAADVVSLSAPTVTSNGVETKYYNIQTLELFTLGGQDNITVSPTATGFLESINIVSGDADDRITVNLLAGVDTEIRIDGGAPSASDVVTVNGTNDSDTIDVNGTVVSSGLTSISLVAVENLVINGGDAEDMISLTGTSVAGSIQLNGNGGDDRFKIAYPMSAGSLQVDGGGSSADALAIDWTNQNDEITVHSSTVYTTGQTMVQYTGVANLILNTFGGEDNVVVAQTQTGSTELNTGEDQDTIIVEQTSGGLEIDAGRANDAIRVRAIGAVATIRGGDGADTISIGSAAPGTGGLLTGIQALLTIVGDADLDTLNIDATGDSTSNSGSLTSSQLTGLGMSSGIVYRDIDAMNITMGAFDDVFDIVSTLDSMALDLKTGAGADVVRVGSINGPTTIHTGLDADTVDIVPSSDSPVDSPLAPSTQSSAINGLLTVIGGDGNADSDTLNFTSPFSSMEAGRLTQDRLTGLQMPEGVNYSGWESFNIALPIDDGIEFSIESTHAGTMGLTTGIGVDTVHVQSIAGATTINTGMNADTVNVGSKTPVTGGNVNAIGAVLTVNGDGDSDTLNVDDTGDLVTNTGTLTSTELTGLGMTGKIVYGTLEALKIGLGGGGDTFTVKSTHSGTTELNMNAGSDTVDVQSIAGVTTINTGSNADTVNVGSLAPAAGGNLNAIDAVLTINGDLDSDTLNVDDTGDMGANTGTLTTTELTGLGMTGKIVYGTLEALKIGLGSGDDTFTVKSTHSGTTELNTNSGVDTVHVQSIAGSTTVNTGSNADTVNVGSTAPVTGGNVDAIGAVLTITGDGDNDTLNVDDTGDMAANTGMLTSTELTGLGMTGKILYGTLEALKIGLGSGDDTFTLKSTHGGTTELNTNAGGDTVQVQSIAGATTISTGSNVDTVNVGSTAPTAGGNVNAIAALLTLQGDGDSDTLNVDDSGDSLANVGTLTNSSLRGLGMASGIDYFDFETLQVDLGSGDDTLTVSSTHARTTTLNTNSGQDTVHLLTVSGQAFVNTQQGNDIVNVQSISAPTTVHSGDGDDTVNVGSKAPATSGTLNLIGAHLSVQGDANSDTLNVDDGGDTISNAGVLTATTLTGLGMGGSITYGGQERLIIDLGIATDTMTVNGTHAGSTVIRNRDGKDTLRMVSNTGEVLFQGGPDNDKLLLDSNYINAPGNDPLVTFTKFEDGRQRGGYWSFNQTQGLIAFESVERFNYLSKVVTPVGKIRTNQQGIEVTSPAVDEDYSRLVANFTVGPIQPLIVDTRAFGNPDFVKINADANSDGNLSPLDALAVINQLNSSDEGLYRASYDVDKDGRVTPLDVLIVIDRLNQPTSYVTVGGDYQFTTRDLNNDGLAEILVVGSVSDRPVLLTLNGVTGGLFDAPIYLSDTPSPFTRYVTTADIDGDGVLEIIISSERGPGEYSIYRRLNGLLVLSAERTVPFQDGYIGGVRLGSGDLNGDGIDEIIVGSGVGADPSVRAYNQFGHLVSNFVLPSSFGRAGVLLKTGDFNGDGLQDLFVASGRRGDSQIAIFNGRSNLNPPINPDYLIDNIFTDPSLIAPIDIALADSDGDERDELFTWQLSDGRNQGVKEFQYDEDVDKFFEQF
jgi:hypothetical protein